MTQASTTLNRGQTGLLHRAGRWGALLCLLACFATQSPARVRHNDAWARGQFAKAERTREALNGRPAAERTRHEYQRAIDAYRRVYFGSPASSKADPSVMATAELLVEMGRRFDDNKILRGAVEGYRFLRKEYPGSKYRFEALFTIGEIYKDDLKDRDQARTAFEDFLHRYPRNRLADDARAAVKEMDDAAADAQRTAHKGPRKGAKGKDIDKDKEKTAANSGGVNSSLNRDSRASSNKGASKGVAPSGDAADAGSGGESSGDASNAESNSDSTSAGARHGELPRVTGVRHWSTPDYTRVAIDIERDVKFDSQRIANPDRIFFDLRDTKLASTLVGKTFDVDDGFLKKIRVAEFQPGRTRIVLEVDDLSSYDAFLLPNPYRLIIDIHGKQSRASLLAKAEKSAPDSAQVASNSSADDADDEAIEDTGGQKVQKKSEKEHAIVAKIKPADEAADREESRLEALLPGEGGRDRDEVDENPGVNSAPTGSSVVKTTVAVKGSNRTIPKTIVDADDDDASRGGRAQTKKHGQSSAANSRTGSMAKASSDSVTRDDSDDGANVVAKALPADARDNLRDNVRDNVQDDRRGTSGTSSLSSRSSKGSSQGSVPSGTSRKKKSRTSSGDDLSDLEMREARPTASGDRSLTRALGLKIGKIVIDAGHGGHDAGTIGPNGLLEKDLVLDVARRLGRLLETRLGAEVAYTRRDDTFVPLETRTAIANRDRADLFISIHANSSRDSGARGVETYYLNFTSSPEALEVAARENAVSEKSIHELQDLVKKIALKDKIDESREFASDVQDSLYGGLSLNSAGVRNRGVKKAPFIVLIGANMPSILAEISFVSNPTDERKLETSEQRQRIAESLYRGVARYAGGLSGVKVASKIDKPAGQ
jgi:N-acetylmuramoyl-L-alanine amidase